MLQEDANVVPTERPSRPVGTRQTVAYAAMASAAPFFFAVSTPQSVPSVFLFGGFVLLAVSLYGVLQLVLLLSGLGRRLPGAYRRGIIATGTILPVLLLMLQSIGQLTVRDILTLGGLCLLGVFYVGKIAGAARR